MVFKITLHQMVTNALVFVMESHFDVAQLSSEHVKKMEDNRNIDCKILKYVKVLSREYWVVLTICTFNSFDQKLFHKVSTLDCPSCFCPDFKFMKSKANRKRKWLPCKHLYFLLQKHFACSMDDVFIHCSRWILNKIKFVLDRVKWMK